MSLNLEPFVVDEALRLKFCPDCDYSLEGLPPEGKCPECGAAYDQWMIVLRARSTSNGAVDTPAQGAGSIASLAVTIAFVVILFESRTLSTPLGLVYATAIMLPFIARLVAWQSSPRPGYILVWMSSAGIAQGTSAAPGTLSSGFLLAVRLFSMFAIAGWFLLEDFSHSAYLILPLLSVTTFFSIARVRRRARLQLPASGSRPAMWPWSALRAVSLTALKHDHYALSASRTDWVSTTFPIRATVELTAAQASALRTCLANWKPKPRRKPSWFERLAGFAGRLLRRLAVRS